MVQELEKQAKGAMWRFDMSLLCPQRDTNDKLLNLKVLFEEKTLNLPLLFSLSLQAVNAARQKQIAGLRLPETYRVQQLSQTKSNDGKNN